MLWPNPADSDQAGRARQQDGHAILNGTAAPSSAAWAEPPALTALSARTRYPARASRTPCTGARWTPASTAGRTGRTGRSPAHAAPSPTCQQTRAAGLLLQGRQEGRHHSRSSPGRRAGVRLRWGHRRAEQSCCWACPAEPPRRPRARPGHSGWPTSPGEGACCCRCCPPRTATCHRSRAPRAWRTGRPRPPRPAAPRPRRGAARPRSLIGGHEAADFDPPTNLFSVGLGLDNAWTPPPAPGHAVVYASHAAPRAGLFGHSRDKNGDK
jgi:hypothetical protein